MLPIIAGLLALGNAWPRHDDRCPWTEFDLAPVISNAEEINSRLADAYEASAVYGHSRTVHVCVHLPSGLVNDARIRLTSGNPALDSLTIEIARDLRFSPAMLGGSPVTVWISLPFLFNARPRPQPSSGPPSALAQKSLVTPKRGLAPPVIGPEPPAVAPLLWTGSD